MEGQISVLVTGGAGFLGSAVVSALLLKYPKWQLSVFDSQPKEKWQRAHHDVSYIQGDVRKAKDCLSAVRESRANVIVHSAGLVPGGLSRYGQQDRDKVFAVNVDGTRNMLEAAKAFGTKVFLHTSSCTVITDDQDHEYPNYSETTPYPKKSLVYGESKAAAEALVLAANDEKFATCALRPSTILGQDDYQLVPSIHACIAKGETLFQIGTADNLYDFTFVDNVADAHVLAIENLLTKKTAAGEAILISNQQAITFRDFMLAVWAEFDHVPKYTIYIPASVAWFMGYASEWVSWLSGHRTTLCRGSVKDAVGTRYCDNTKAKEILGYEARIPLWEGIRLSCQALAARLLLEGALTLPEDDRANGKIVDSCVPNMRKVFNRRADKKYGVGIGWMPYK